MVSPTLDGIVQLEADEAGLVQGGAVAPLVAILLVPLAGAVSFSVDMGYLSTTSRQTQAASDTAALAGSYAAVSGAGNRR